VAQPTKGLANLAADLGLAKEPPESLSSGPGQLPQQTAKEPLRRQLPTAIPGLPATIHGLATPEHGGNPGGCLERQEVAQTAKGLANLAADLGLAKEPPESLSSGPGQLPQQVAKESLRRQLPTANTGVHLWCIH
jgi:hypothetical protein